MFSTLNPPSGFYLYAYLREDGSPYYIGKGKDKRAWKRTQRDMKPPKDCSRIIIMEQNLTEVGSLALERFYIKWYGRKCDYYLPGYLYLVINFSTVLRLFNIEIDQFPVTCRYDIGTP